MVSPEPGGTTRSMGEATAGGEATIGGIEAPARDPRGAQARIVAEELVRRGWDPTEAKRFADDHILLQGRKIMDALRMAEEGGSGQQAPRSEATVDMPAQPTGDTARTQPGQAEKGAGYDVNAETRPARPEERPAQYDVGAETRPGVPADPLAGLAGPVRDKILARQRAEAASMDALSRAGRESLRQSNSFGELLSTVEAADRPGDIRRLETVGLVYDGLRGAERQKADAALDIARELLPGSGVDGIEVAKYIALHAVRVNPEAPAGLGLRTTASPLSPEVQAASLAVEAILAQGGKHSPTAQSLAQSTGLPLSQALRAISTAETFLLQ